MGCCSATTIQQIDYPAGRGEDFHGRYDLNACIGRGSYGTVYRAGRKGSDVAWAVKVVALARGASAMQPLCDIKTKRQTLREIQAESAAWNEAGQHPNILSLEEWFMDKHFAYFVMELCSGSLLQAWTNKDHLNEYTYAEYFQDMASALDHIHAQGIVHRDIKHDNFLVGGPSGRQVKLCDFGLSAVMATARDLRHACGTAPYMAPEMVAHFGAHGTASDVWSFGVIVYVAFFGEWPYKSKNLASQAMKKAIREGTVPPSFQPPKRYRQTSISEAAMSFVRQILVRDTQLRPRAANILRMDYLLHKDIHWQQASGRSLASISLSPLLYQAFRSCSLSARRPQAHGQDVSTLVMLQAQAKAKRATTNPSAELETFSSETTRDEFSGDNMFEGKLWYSDWASENDICDIPPETVDVEL